MFLIGIVVGITVLVGGEIIGVFALEPKIHPKQKQIDKRYNVKIVRFLLFIIFRRKDCANSDDFYGRLT